MCVAHEAGDARGVTNDRPGVLVEVHAHEHVARNTHAGDHLALAVLDLHDFFHGDLNLVDVVDRAHRLATVPQVRLHLALVASVAVHDVPLAWLGAQLALELGVGVGSGLLFSGGLVDHGDLFAFSWLHQCVECRVELGLGSVALFARHLTFLLSFVVRTSGVQASCLEARSPRIGMPKAECRR